MIQDWEKALNAKNANNVIPNNPVQPGPVKSAVQNTASGVMNIYNAPGNFFSNLQNHIGQTLGGLAQGVGQAVHTGVDSLANALEPYIQNADPNSAQYAPSKSMTQMRAGQDPLAQTPAYQQTIQEQQNNKQLGGLGAGLKTANAATQALLVNPANEVFKPLGQAWQGITNKLNPIIDALSGQKLGTTQLKNDSAGQQTIQAYQQWAQQNPKTALALETLATQVQGAMAVVGATQAAEGLKAGYNRLQAQAEANPIPAPEAPKSNIVYRGQAKGEQGGRFFTTDQQEANNYAGLNKNSEVIQKDISTLKLKPVTSQQMLSEMENPDPNYDGITFKDPRTGTQTVGLFNPDAETGLVPKTKLSPEMQNAEGNLTQAKSELSQAQTNAQLAQEARNAVAKPAVENAGEIQSSLKGARAQMGENFGNAATQVEQADPSLRLNLTNEQLTALNDLKQGKNFALPDKLDVEKNPTAMVGGKSLDLSQMNPKIAAQIKEQLGTMGGETASSLTPTEAQDLITRLNQSTYKEVGGTLQVDQQRVALTNEIKDAAQSAFGHITDENGNSIWNEAYQNYAQGSKAIQSFENLLNLKPKSTPNNVITNILKLDTPEQKLILQNMTESLQDSPAQVDLSNPIKTIQQIADKQEALDEANSDLSDAQKALNQAQRAKDVLVMKETLKNATFAGRHPDLANMFKYELKRAVWGATGGLAMSLFVYAYVRKLINGTTTKPKPLK